MTQLTHHTETASQTGGPYVHIGLAPLQAGFEIFDTNFGNVLPSAHTKGERIAIEGQVFDGSGTPLRDVLIEIWQADAEGHYAHPADPHPSSFRKARHSGVARLSEEHALSERGAGRRGRPGAAGRGRRRPRDDDPAT